MFTTRISVLFVIALAGTLGAQTKQADYSRTFGNAEFGGTVDLETDVTHGRNASGDYSLSRASNTARFRLGGIEGRGIEVQALSYGGLYNGRLSATNWNGVYRGDDRILSYYHANGWDVRSFPTITVQSRTRTYPVGAFQVRATLHVRAGAAHGLRHTGIANSLQRAAFLDGYLRTWQTGYVSNVVGLDGASAAVSSTVDMADSRMDVDLDAAPGWVAGNFRYSNDPVTLYLHVLAIRGRGFATRTLVNDRQGSRSGTLYLR